MRSARLFFVTEGHRTICLLKLCHDLGRRRMAQTNEI